MCGCGLVVRESEISASDCASELRGVCHPNDLRLFWQGSGEPDTPWPAHEVWSWNMNASGSLWKNCVDQPLTSSFVRLVWDEDNELLTVMLSDGSVNGTLAHNATVTSRPTGYGLLYFERVSFPRSPNLFSIRAVDAFRRQIVVYSQASFHESVPRCELYFDAPSFNLEPTNVQIVGVVTGCVIFVLGAAAALFFIVWTKRKERNKAGYEKLPPVN